MRRARAALIVAVAFALLGCGGRDATTKPAPAGHDLSSIRAFEDASRASSDFERAASSDHALGPDPYVVAPLAGGRFVGLLRGRDAIVLLDAKLGETARVNAPASASALAVSGNEVFAVGEWSGRVDRFSVADGLEKRAPIDLGDVTGLRGIAVGPERVLYAVEEHGDRLLWAPLEHGPKGEAVICRGPFRIARAGAFVVVDCLLDHEIVALPVDEQGAPLVDRAVRMRRDGPMWGFDAEASEAGLFVASGGVEDHPLDRTEGSFGFIDSFVYLDVLRAGASSFEHVASVNVSELAVVTPKAVALTIDGSTARAFVSGYASANAVELAFDLRGDVNVPSRVVPSLPGIASLARAEDGFVAADPLLDAWVVLGKDAPRAVAVPDAGAPPRGDDSKLGEALFFTTSMAPWNKTEGRLSRFSCETCHFEGYVDGRTHHTGRAEVHATTRPLLGLFNDRPYFSRALDPDLTTMTNNEFRVAGAKSDHDPWFSLGAADAPWLASMGFGGRTFEPADLRRALIAFFKDFSPRSNPRAQGRSKFSALEREGAEAFGATCSGCHVARTASDVASTEIPFARWEELVLSPGGPIVWGQDRYEKTGIEPYVHDKGARIPALRRLYKKRPYFTNGSAPTIDAVLDRARVGSGAFLHDDAKQTAGLAPLGGATKHALAAFLDLL